MQLPFLISCIFIQCIVVSYQLAIGVMLPIFMVDFNMSVYETVSIAGLSWGIFCLGSFIAIPLNNIYTTNYISLIGIILWSLGIWFLTLCNSIPEIFICTIFISIGSSFCFWSVLNMLIQQTIQHGRILKFMIFGCSISSGIFIYLLSILNWRTFCKLYVEICSPIMIFLTFFLTEPFEVEVQKWKLIVSGVKCIVYSSNCVWLGFIFGFTALVIQVPFQLILLENKDDWILILMCLFGVVGVQLSQLLCIHLGSIKTIQLLFLLQSICCFSWIGCDNYISLYVFASIYGSISFGIITTFSYLCCNCWCEELIRIYWFLTFIVMAPGLFSGSIIAYSFGVEYMKIFCGSIYFITFILSYKLRYPQ